MRGTFLADVGSGLSSFLDEPCWRRQRIPSRDDVVTCYGRMLVRETIPVGASSSAG